MTRKGSIAPAIYVIFLMVPIYWLIVMSFKTNAEIGSGLTLIPQNPTLENYQFIFGDPDWYWGYVNAIIYVLMNVVISIFVAVPAAYAFSRYRFLATAICFLGSLHFECWPRQSCSFHLSRYLHSSI